MIFLTLILMIAVIVVLMALYFVLDQIGVRMTEPVLYTLLTVAVIIVVGLIFLLNKMFKCPPK